MYDVHTQRSAYGHVVQSAILTLCILAGLMPSTRTPSAAAQELTPLTATAVPTAVALTYSSYLGGASADHAKSVALDADGNIYIAGETFSEDFVGRETSISGYSDIYVAKLDPTGKELRYLAIVGSDDSDYALALDVDAAGNAYVTGSTYADTFTTKHPLWAAPPEMTNSVLFKLDGSGNLVYSTYLPLDVFDARRNLAVDAAGNAYVTGSYPWVEENGEYWGSQVAFLKLDPTGQTVLLNKHVGGTGPDKGIALTRDAAGTVYIAGTTETRDDFPVTANAHQPVCGDIVYDPEDGYCFKDGVVVVFDAAGKLTYASYHGGSFSDDPQAIVADGQGTVIVAGNTASGEFPLLQPVVSECPVDAEYGNCYSSFGFASAIRIQAGKSALVYSTYLGARERASTNTVYAAAIDGTGSVYITGYTNGKQFPMKDALDAELHESFCYTFSSQRYCFDGYVVKLSPAGALAFSTYLGATFDDYPYGVTVGKDGALYVVGTTEADDFPVTQNAFQPNNTVEDDAFLVRLGSGDTPGGEDPGGEEPGGEEPGGEKPDNNPGTGIRRKLMLPLVVR